MQQIQARPRMRPIRALRPTTRDSVTTAATNRQHSSTIGAVMDSAMLENIKLKPKITKATHAVSTATVCLREPDIKNTTFFFKVNSILT